MMLLVFLVSLSCRVVIGQSAVDDVLLLKKGKNTIAKYFAGGNISFFTRERKPVVASIDSIRRDSLFLKQYNIRMLPTGYGTFTKDTAGSYLLAYSLLDVAGFPAIKQRGRNIITDGTVLKWGAAGFIVLNLVNATRENDPPFGKDNRPALLSAVGTYVLGWGLGKLWTNHYTIGRKYRLEVLARGKW